MKPFFKWGSHVFCAAELEEWAGGWMGGRMGKRKDGGERALGDAWNLGCNLHLSGICSLDDSKNALAVGDMCLHCCGGCLSN